MHRVSKETRLFVAQLSCRTTTSQGIFKSKTKYPLKLRFIAQTSIHRIFGAVVGLAGYMDWACAFFMPILIALGYPQGATATWEVRNIV